MDHHDSYIVALAVAVAAAVVVGMLGCIAQFGHFEIKLSLSFLLGLGKTGIVGKCSIHQQLLVVSIVGVGFVVGSEHNYQITAG